MGTSGRWGAGLRLFALVLLAACGLVCDDDDSSSDGDDGVTDPLTADLIAPDITTAVPVDAVIRIQLSRAPATPVAGNCVEVIISGDESVHPTTTSLVGTLTLEVTHAGAPFESGRNYEAVLYADRISPASGDPMEGDATWYFTTAEPDEVPDFGDVELQEELDGFSSGVDVAGSGEGSGIAVFWYEELDSASPTMWQHIYASAITECQAGDPVLLLFDAGDRGEPAVAVNADGAAIAAGPFWDRVGAATHGIWIQHYDPLPGWSEAATAPIPTHAEAVQFVNVGIDADGNGMVSYLAPPTGAISSWHIEYTVYTAAAETWGSPVALDSGVDVSDPRLAMNDAGTSIVVASEDAAGGSVRYYCPSGGNGRVAIPVGSTASQARVDMSPHGEAFVIWREENAAMTESRIPVARITACGTPVIEFVDGGAGNVLSHPHIAVGPGSAATAAWVQQRPTADYAVMVNHYTPAGGWGGTPTTLMTSSLPIHGTHVAISSTGQITVLGFSSESAEVSTRVELDTWSDPHDVTTVPNPMSIQLVDFAEHAYIGESRVVVGFLTNIGGVQNAGLTLCD